MTTIRTVSERVLYERLANGLDLFLLPTNVPDIVVCRLAFPGGVYATYARRALAQLVGELMPAGTKGMGRRTVRERLEGTGAEVTVDEGAEHLFVSIASRTVVFAEVLELVLATLTLPALTAREFSEAVTHLDTSLEHAEDDTRVRATSAFLQALYRKGHPHWTPTPHEARADLRNAALADVLAFHKDTFSAVGAVAVIAGDVGRKKVGGAAQSLLAQVPAARAVRLSDVAPDRTNDMPERDIVVSLREKMNVDTFLAVPLAVTRQHDDYLALWLATQVLGGGSTGRLFNELRTRQSLTYDGRASLGGFGDGYAGFLLASTILPNDVFARGRSALREIVARWADKGVTAAELVRVKEQVAGRHKIGLSTTHDVADAVFTAVLAERPVSYVDEYPTLIGALTLRAVNRAIKQHVRYDLAVTAGAGAVDEGGHPLRQ